MAWLWGAGGQTQAGGSVLGGKPCFLCFQVGFSLFCLGVVCGGMLLGFRAPSRILHLKFPFKLYISTARILSHEVFSVSHGGHGNKAKKRG